jgi:FkbM family methyltransferase
MISFPPYSEIINVKNFKFIVFPNDAITQHIKSGRDWEPHFEILINNLIKKGDCVIDCGANFGYNSVLMGKIIGNYGKLISFEPQNIIYQQLNGNLILNNIFNSITYKNIVSNQSNKILELDSIDLSSSWVNIGDISVGSGGEKTSTITIDDLNLVKLDFIKIDVQGFEYFVLDGASKSINEFSPDIFIEIEEHLIEKFNITKNMIYDKLKFLGYNIYKINNDYPCDYICTIKNIDIVESLYSQLNLIKID